MRVGSIPKVRERAFISILGSSSAFCIVMLGISKMGEFPKFKSIIVGGAPRSNNITGKKKEEEKR